MLRASRGRIFPESYDLQLGKFAEFPSSSSLQLLSEENVKLVWIARVAGMSRMIE